MILYSRDLVQNGGVMYLCKLRNLQYILACQSSLSNSIYCPNTIFISHNLLVSS